MTKNFVKLQTGDIVEEYRLDIHDRQTSYKLLILEAPEDIESEYYVLVLDTGQVTKIRLFENEFRSFKKLA